MLLVTGATGLIGRALVAKAGPARVVSRDPEYARLVLGPDVAAYPWRPEREALPLEALRDVDVVFHLAGEPLTNGRWTSAKKRRIRDSRVLSTRNLVAALAAAESRARVLVSASAVGFYGDRGDEELDEASARGAGFLADVCAEWEREALAAERLGLRVVCVRTGVVLAASGGALAKMLPPFRVGAGGRLGSGRQWTSWIHLEDHVRLLLYASVNEAIRGPLNAVAPHPVTNSELTRALSHALHRPAPFAVPAMVLRLALGEMSQVLTASQRVQPRLAERTGFTFSYPRLEGALAAVLGR